jgi:hypothetical protein
MCADSLNAWARRRKEIDVDYGAMACAVASQANA